MAGCCGDSGRFRGLEKRGVLFGSRRVKSEVGVYFSDVLVILCQGKPARTERPSMNRTARIVILAISVVVFCYAGLGQVLGETHEERAYKSLTVYGGVLQKVQQDYVDEPNMHLVTAGALHGLLE